MTAKISACIITKNEEKHIRKCLESIKNVVDEIVIVDGYSIDKTIDICKEYTDKIYIQKFSGSFAEEVTHNPATPTPLPAVQKEVPLREPTELIRASFQPQFDPVVLRKKPLC